jgi:hypothetical protein
VRGRQPRVSPRRTGTIGSGSASAIATCSIAAASRTAHQSIVADCITMPTSSGCAALKAAAEHAVDLLAGEFQLSCWEEAGLGRKTHRRASLGSSPRGAFDLDQGGTRDLMILGKGVSICRKGKQR